ncbi:MAG TPA: 2OG-Fe(II) oxygenase [Allosphingosinicella sp.]|jgi:PKHD-type hydroxylase
MTRIHVDRSAVFTAAECERLIALAGRSELAPAPTYGGADHVPPDRMRRVSVSMQGRGEATAWFFDRLDALFADAAAELGVAVRPMTEPVQILRYAPGDHFQAWHTDAGADRTGDRLLSVSVELSDLGAHEGGDLEILPDLIGRARTLERGGARIFVSRALHRVTPVRSGTRWALVNWTGPAPPFAS